MCGPPSRRAFLTRAANYRHTARMTASTNASRRQATRWLTTLALIALALIALMRIYHYWSAAFGPDWPRIAFYDFRLWRTGIERYVETGRLYDVDTPGYFLAGSHSLFKYPPTFAALLRPFAGQPQRSVGLLFFVGHLGLLFATLGIILRASRLSRRHAFLIGLLFLLWQPTWEDLGDLQMEPILLFCLALAWAQMRRGNALRVGAPVGVAGAFKVYPWVLAIHFALLKRWRSLAGVAIGAVAALAAAALILPPRLTLEFFTRILPGIGGTSLAHDNLSLLASMGRLALWLRSGALTAEQLDPLQLETPGPAGLIVPRSLATLFFLVVAAALLIGLWRALRGRRRSLDAGEAQVFGLAICLLLVFIPTSWTCYQTLLVLPFLAAVAQTPRPLEDLMNCALLGYVALIGCTLNGYDASYAAQPTLFSVARSLVPLALATVLLRRLRRIDAVGA
jgi:hypothetical protein